MTGFEVESPVVGASSIKAGFSVSVTGDHSENLSKEGKDACE